MMIRSNILFDQLLARYWPTGMNVSTGIKASVLQKDKVTVNISKYINRIICGSAVTVKKTLIVAINSCRFSFIELRNEIEIGADKPETPWSIPAQKPAIGATLFAILRLRNQLELRILKIMKANTTTASDFCRRSGLKIAKKYVPILIPKTPEIANPQTSCLDLW